MKLWVGVDTKTDGTGPAGIGVAPDPIPEKSSAVGSWALSAAWYW